MCEASPGDWQGNGVIFFIFSIIFSFGCFLTILALSNTSYVYIYNIDR